MTKHAKGLWAVGALVLGLGMGFTAGTHTEARESAAPGIVECSRDSQCDARCDGPGSGACQMGRCYCLR
ncbi:hypothetical protein [Melittangium boletus]|uniref:Lipoprotein n=1 Tax=Melittangium boletus DSM 14713 TaxID=1294270 RepID=A0A250IHQ6_9BACT|nr:hypothetical protein [Melittangium boletus]ATB30763.1 hypothetical protein MEBOL_004225 [Melittangium boletus DSM 14713]